MIARFKDHISKNSLFVETDRLILALSGGIDSVALFHLLRLSGYKFEVAHVNYGLRGSDSDKDEQFVKTLCDDYKIDFSLKKIRPEYWENVNFNIQNEARSIRYLFFNQLVKLDSDKILTAHQLDDNLETVLMNFARGTGITGMLGIQNIKDNIVRPLLNFTRKELLKFLSDHNFSWREDKSNASNKYKRNRFRNKIIPLFVAENPSFLKAFGHYIEQLNPVYDYYQAGLKNFKSKHLVQENDCLKLTWETGEELSLFLFHVINKFGFNQTQTNNIIATIDQPGKTFLSDTHIISIDRNRIFICKIAKKLSKKIEIHPSTTSISEPIELLCSISKNTTLQKDSAIGQFDFDKLMFPLTLRKWKPGDKISPLGMRGKKKISDILIDHKIPKAEKESVFVLESNGEIIWLVGMVISNNFKVSSMTQKVWKAQLLLDSD